MEKDKRLLLIVIDPRFQVHYSSYYIYGLKQICNQVRFGWLGDDAMKIESNSQLRKGFAFVVHYANGFKKRVFIDTFDDDTFDDMLLQWCDVYGKVNVNLKDKGIPKLVPLGPSFAIRLWSPLASIYHSIRNYCVIKMNKGLGINPTFKDILHSFGYLHYRRKPLKDYLEDYEEDKDYVFSMNTLWYDKLSSATTNHLRGVFVSCCKELMPSFEGGFFYVNDKSILDDFPDYSQNLVTFSNLISTKRVSMNEYIQKTRRSSFVFNTPAVNGCLGWKLGEYLALGKAIISTQINNILPIEDSEELPFMVAYDEDQIKNCIIKMKSDVACRMHYKRLARMYFHNTLDPTKSVSRLLLNE